MAEEPERCVESDVETGAENLRALGVSVERIRETTGEKRRLIELNPTHDAVTLVTAVTGPATAATGGDAGSDASPAAAVTPADQQLQVPEPVGACGDAGDASDAVVRAATAEEEAMIDGLRQRHADLLDEDTA